MPFPQIEIDSRREKPTEQSIHHDYTEIIRMRSRHSCVSNPQLCLCRFGLCDELYSLDLPVDWLPSRDTQCLTLALPVTERALDKLDCFIDGNITHDYHGGCTRCIPGIEELDN